MHTFTGQRSNLTCPIRGHLELAFTLLLTEQSFCLSNITGLSSSRMTCHPHGCACSHLLTKVSPLATQSSQICNHCSHPSAEPLSRYSAATGQMSPRCCRTGWHLSTSRGAWLQLSLCTCRVSAQKHHQDNHCQRALHNLPSSTEQQGLGGAYRDRGVQHPEAESLQQVAQEGIWEGPEYLQRRRPPLLQAACGCPRALPLNSEALVQNSLCSSSCP